LTNITHHYMLNAYHVQKAVSIRVRKGTRDGLHSIKHRGQTLDGIIGELIDLWERQKQEAAQSKKGVK